MRSRVTNFPSALLDLPGVPPVVLVWEDEQKQPVYECQVGVYLDKRRQSFVVHIATGKWGQSLSFLSPNRSPHSPGGKHASGMQDASDAELAANLLVKMMGKDGYRHNTPKPVSVDKRESFDEHELELGRKKLIRAAAGPGLEKVIF